MAKCPGQDRRFGKPGGTFIDVDCSGGRVIYRMQRCFSTSVFHASYGRKIEDCGGEESAGGDFGAKYPIRLGKRLKTYRFFIDRTTSSSYHNANNGAANNFKMIKQHYFRPTYVLIVFVILLGSLHKATLAYSPADEIDAVKDAAIKLVQLCDESKATVDEQAAGVLADYVLAQKKGNEQNLPKLKGCAGAYSEFDTNITLPRLLEYSYSPFILSVITRPSSLRYSFWTHFRNDKERIPATWRQLPPGGSPVVIHGKERDSNSPDLNTGVYHEYNLKRTLVQLNYKGRQVLLSISKQIGQSDVGKKGFILGKDNDWHYYYTGEVGSTMTGLGWAESYIYDYFSVSVYVESKSSPTVVRTGVFQWLRAGWAGMNFVNSGHILKGMRRFARDCKTVLESPRLPGPNKMFSVHQWLSNMPSEALAKNYLALRKAQRSSAIKSGKIDDSEEKGETSVTQTPKEQMVEELMLEYLKTALGKTALLKMEWDNPSTIQ